MAENDVPRRRRQVGWIRRGDCHRDKCLSAIPDDAADWDVRVTGAPRLAATLAARRDDALLYKQLATLARDVPLSESLDDLVYRGAPRAAFEALCAQLEVTPRWNRFRD